LKTEKLLTETAIEQKAAMRSLEIKFARQGRLIRMLLSTRGSGRPGADTDDGNDNGVSNAVENGDTQETNPPSDLPGKEFIPLVFFMCIYCWYSGDSVSLLTKCRNMRVCARVCVVQISL